MNRRQLSALGFGVLIGLMALSPGQLSASVPGAVVVEGTSGLVIENVDIAAFPSVLVTVGVAGGLKALEESGEQFRLTENGVDRPITIEESGNAEQLNVVIVIDRSGSMASRPMQAAKNAALAFIDALPTEVAIGLVSFSTDATVDVPITQNRDELIAAVEAIYSDGNTSLYDGVIQATQLFDPSVERKVLVVLSDGGDNDSEASLEEAVSAVQGLTVEMIELATPESEREPLNQLAAPLPVRSTEDPAQLEELYTSVAQRLVGRVGLRYESLVQPGATASIVVTLGEGETARSTSQQVNAPVPPTTTTVAPSTTLPVAVVVEPDTEEKDTTTARVISFILICGGFLVSAYYATDRRVRPTRQRLIPKGTSARGRARTRDLFSGIKRSLESNERSKQLVMDITSLGSDRTPGSIILRTIWVAVAFAILGMLLQGLLLGLVFALLVFLFARSRLKSKVASRRNDFIAQLPETLSTLSSMLRTGYGLLQALDAVAEEATEPTKSWLSRVILEVSTGRDLIEALRALALELNSIDFDWVIAGIEISRETGGDLAKTMDTVAETIRERDKLRGQIKALTAEGRISAYVMLALPPSVGAFSFLINPDFAGVFLEPIGVVLLSVTGLLMTLGYFWMRGMINKVTL